MKCSRVKRRIPLYAGGDLAVHKAKRVSRHLEKCLSCQAELAAFCGDREALKGLGQLKMHEEFWKSYSKELGFKLREKDSLHREPSRWSVLGVLLGLRGAPLTVPVAIIALLLGFYLGSLNRGGAPSLPLEETSGKKESVSPPPGVEPIPANTPVNYPMKNITPFVQHRYSIGGVPSPLKEEKRKEGDTGLKKNYPLLDKSKIRSAKKDSKVHDF